MFDPEQIEDQRRRHRLWLDRVKAHGPDLLDALKQLVALADKHIPTGRGSDNADSVINRAHTLIDKLEGKR